MTPEKLKVNDPSLIDARDERGSGLLSRGLPRPSLHMEVVKERLSASLASTSLPSPPVDYHAQVDRRSRWSTSQAHRICPGDFCIDHIEEPQFRWPYRRDFSGAACILVIITAGETSDMAQLRSPCRDSL